MHNAMAVVVVNLYSWNKGEEANSKNQKLSH